ncbi:cupin domain-containing protein [Sulfurospirillum sp. 1612]|uniref:cupin domain-containing protein n=1 Tax=Sulfurospirillum sp. 1612 TaxID=3094835 RepID=UPI002F94C529
MVKNITEYEFTPLESGVGGSMSVLIGNDKAPHFAMRKFIIKQGGSMPLHTNSVEHEQYVLNGSAKVVIGDEESIAKKDDVLFIPAGVAHSYDVIGDEDYEFLCLVPNMEDEIKILS